MPGVNRGLKMKGTIQKRHTYKVFRVFGWKIACRLLFSRRVVALNLLIDGPGSFRERGIEMNALNDIINLIVLIGALGLVIIPLMCF